MPCVGYRTGARRRKASSRVPHEPPASVADFRQAALHQRPYASINFYASGELPALAPVTQSKSIGQVTRDACKCILSEQSLVARLFNLPPSSKEISEILETVFCDAHVAVVTLCLSEAKHDTLLYVTMLYELDSLLELCVASPIPPSFSSLVAINS